MELMKDTILSDTIRKTGGSWYVHVAPEVAEFMKFSEGDKICIKLEEGKHGRFLSIWKQEEPKK